MSLKLNSLGFPLMPKHEHDYVASAFCPECGAALYREPVPDPKVRVENWCCVACPYKIRTAGVMIDMSKLEI